MKKIGVIAGTHQLPILFAQQAKKQGYQVFAVNFDEAPNPKIAKEVDGYTRHSIGQLGKTIQFFKSQGIRDIVMQGQVTHKTLYKKIKPDFKAAMLLLKIAASPKGTEGILKPVADLLKKNGLNLLPATWLMEPWLAQCGVMGKIKPSRSLKQDLEYGAKLVKAIGALDIGQTVLVKNQSAVAIESIEGTDAAIKRAGKLAGKGVVMVKRARPNQDLRFDLPVVGLKTFKALAAVGAAAVGLEAGKTLMLDKEACLALANKAKISVVAI